MQLSKRLQAVASFVKTGKTMADIGTDHGYIPIYLVKNKICRKAIAMDVKKGPLERAKEHIGEQRLNAYIETRLSDGLDALAPKEVETIVIAGMGGATINKILAQGSKIADAALELILQPQSEWMEVRGFLEREGYYILGEDMVLEDGKYYPMMRVRKEPHFVPHLVRGKEDEFHSVELKYGPRLLEQRHPVLQKYLIWQEEQKEKVLMQLSKNAAWESREKREDQIQEELRDIRKALTVFREI